MNACVDFLCNIKAATIDIFFESNLHLSLSKQNAITPNSSDSKPAINLEHNILNNQCTKTSVSTEAIFNIEQNNEDTNK